MNNNYGRLGRNLGLALGIVAAIIWLQGALAAIIIVLLAAILYRFAQPAPSRG
jgi:membrane protein implicated in regulation of membrane protease activity